MAERTRPAVFNIPAHRAFADALAAGILAQHGKDPLALARGIILLPNNRAVRAISDAFVRRSEGGLLMPRLVPIGDIELDERLGSALEPMGQGGDIPPAIGAMERQMILARLVQRARDELGHAIDAGEAMRLAQALATTLDQMLVEEVSPARLHQIDVAPELSSHWQASLHLFELVLDRWPQELEKRGMIDATERRNRLLRHVAQRWATQPPAGFVVAAGIASTAPAVCAVLRTVAFLPQGQLVLSELDQVMEQEDWDAIGPFPPDPVTGKRKGAHESHPQYALKLLLDRIGVARDEVALWRWGGKHDARAERSRTISHAMLVPSRTAKWREVPTSERNLSGVRALECATPAQEAQAIAILLREALETPERTAALVTPDRALAIRVSAHLRRWGVAADDSAGRPLNQLPPGTLLLALAEVMAQRFAPVPLLNLFKHPLVQKGEARGTWLSDVRALDLLLRGPRPAPGLAGMDAMLSPRPAGEQDRQAALRAEARLWWQEQARPLLAPLEVLGHGVQAPDAVFAVLREVAGKLSNDAIWVGHQGHAASDLFAEIEGALHLGPDRLDIEALPDLLERLLSPHSVRPPQGGHPRIAIYGLLEARLQQADIVILAGLNEGTWPTLPSPDPWLAPRIRQELGLPGLDHRIGLAAHDFASGLGAPEVVISRARRSGNAPAVASRFWLRLQALAGDRFKRADEYVRMADMLDRPEGQPLLPSKPAPCPDVALRPTRVSVTEVDRLAADPYAFYARKILGLGRLDRIDADPTAAWRGTAVHRILEQWFREDDCNPATLQGRAEALLRSAEAHPVMRALWQPRLLAALEWIAAQVQQDATQGRTIALVEADGRIEIAGITLHGKADRIDTLPDGSVAIVDYKTGRAPTAREVMAGYALQLGLLGVIAERGGFADLGGERVASAFEYWTLAKDKDAFGARKKPTGDKASDKKLATDELTVHAEDRFTEYAVKWLTGDAPFEASLNPDAVHYTEYDQLMRLEEWYGRSSHGGEEPNG